MKKIIILSILAVALADGGLYASNSKLPKGPDQDVIGKKLYKQCILHSALKVCEPFCIIKNCGQGELCLSPIETGLAEPACLKAEVLKSWCPRGEPNIKKMQIEYNGKQIETSESCGDMAKCMGLGAVCVKQHGTLICKDSDNTSADVLQEWVKDPTKQCLPDSSVLKGGSADAKGIHYLDACKGNILMEQACKDGELSIGVNCKDIAPNSECKVSRSGAYCKVDEAYLSDTNGDGIKEVVNCCPDAAPVVTDMNCVSSQFCGEGFICLGGKCTMDMQKNIVFEDKNLEKGIKDELIKKGVNVDDGITPCECAKLDTLKLNGYRRPDSKQIKSLKGLESCLNVSALELPYNQISSIVPLSNLAKLTKLELSTNNISDISVVSKLTNLTDLRMGDNKIADIEPVKGLTKLTVLNVVLNKVSDITPLKELSNLKALHLAANPLSDADILELSNYPFNATLSQLGINSCCEGGKCLSDVSPLEKFPALTYLNISWDNFDDEDVQKLATFPLAKNLSQFSAGSNCVTGKCLSNISPLTSMTGLKILHLDGNNFDDADIKELSNFSYIPGLSVINLGKNCVEAGKCLSDISNIKKLTGASALFIGENNFDDADIAEFTAEPLAKDVISFDISKNCNASGTCLSAVGPLEKMTGLKMLAIRENDFNDKDLAALAGFACGKEFTYLDMGKNCDPSGQCISNIGPVGAMVNIGDIYLGGNQINNIDVLPGILKPLGLVNLQGNPLNDPNADSVIQALLDKEVVVIK